MKLNHFICPSCGHDFYEEGAYSTCDKCQHFFYLSCANMPQGVTLAPVSWPWKEWPWGEHGGYTVSPQHFTGKVN